MNITNTKSSLMITRIVSGIVAAILLLAFYILYLTPDSTDTSFAWEIKPAMTALLMGAGYLGGAFFFMMASMSTEWHRVKAGFLGVSTFTVFMFLATLLHWDRFFLTSFPFRAWFVLYAVSPILLTWLWWRNRSADLGKPAAKDVVVPNPIMWLMRIAGLGFSLVAFIGFIFPALLINIWPWTLTPLTARVICGWFSLVGVGSLLLSFDSRWTAWRITFLSIGIWTALLLIGVFLHPADFTKGLVNWLTVGLSAQLIGMIVLYVVMESRLKKA